jgi:hypothetical protein
MPFGSAPSSEALQSAIATLDAKAAFNGSEQEVHVRVAPSPDGSVYIDLGNAEWNAIEITLDGWEVVGNPSICQVHQAQGLISIGQSGARRIARIQGTRGNPYFRDGEPPF